MERIDQLLESLSRGEGMIPVLSYMVFVAAGMIRKGKKRGFLGDNLPFTLMDDMKKA